MKQKRLTTCLAVGSLTLALTFGLCACGSNAVLSVPASVGMTNTDVLAFPSFFSVPAPDETIEQFMAAVYGGDAVTAAALSAHGVTDWLGRPAATEYGIRLQDLLRSSWSYSISSITQDQKNATAVVHITGLDVEKAAVSAHSGLYALLEERVTAAASSAEIYGKDGKYRPEVLSAAFDTLFPVLFVPETCTTGFDVPLSLTYTDKAWQVTDVGSLQAAITGGGTDPDSDAQALYNAATSNQPRIRIRYTLPEDSAVPGNVPNPAGYGLSYDPAEVLTLLQTPDARNLINGQEVVFREGLDFLPGAPIRYYLDETILMIQWQEVTAKAVGTYAEVFLADASQIRRKFVNDVFGGWDFDAATNLAMQTNAVLASGGDLYNHGRACGIVVYNREIYRFEPNTCDTCYIDTSGNLLFSYRWQFSEQAEAEQFIAENDILFSLCFGPVMILDGENVTPESYAWGEIDDTYARAALGQMGDLHYLTLNINCQQPNYYYLATLQQATDAMLAHGVPKCYALDGGQTASTIVAGELINPVQFGYERMVSDILYFASAMPENGG